MNELTAAIREFLHQTQQDNKKETSLFRLNSYSEWIFYAKKLFQLFYNAFFSAKNVCFRHYINRKTRSTGNMFIIENICNNFYGMLLKTSQTWHLRFTIISWKYGMCVIPNLFFNKSFQIGSKINSHWKKRSFWTENFLPANIESACYIKDSTATCIDWT